MRTTTGSGIGGPRRGWRAGQRQREEERHSAFGQVLRPDVPAVRLHDALTDREPQAGATAADGEAPVELLEDLVFLAARQPRAAVRDLDGNGSGRRGPPGPAPARPRGVPC